MTTSLTAPLFDYEGRIVSLLGRIESPHIDLLVDQLLRLETERADDITFYVSSQGGTLVDAFKVIDVMGTLRSPVTAIAMGLVQGAGVPVFAAAHKRLILPNALLSTSGLWAVSGLEIQPATGFGFAAVHPRDALVKELEAQVERLRPASLSRLVREAAAAPRLFTAEQAVAVHLADAIAPARKSMNSSLPKPIRHVR